MVHPVKDLQQIHLQSSSSHPSALEWNSCYVLWDMKILEFYIIIIPCKGVYVTKFCVGGLARSTFLPHLQHIYTHIEKPLTTKPQDIKMDYNYPLRKHDDIIISVSVYHYPLFLSFFSSKTHHMHFCFAAVFIPLLILPFLRYWNSNHECHTLTTSQHIHTTGLKSPILRNYSRLQWFKATEWPHTSISTHNVHDAR